MYSVISINTSLETKIFQKTLITFILQKNNELEFNCIFRFWSGRPGAHPCHEK